MTVYEYFNSKLYENPQDSTLKDLSLNTPCGKACSKAIDAAHRFMQASDPSVHPVIVMAANQAVEVFWRG